MRFLLAALVLWIAPGFAPIPLAEAADNIAVRDCLAYGVKEFDISDEDAFKRELQSFRTICQRALFLDGTNPKIKLSLARAWSAQGFKNVSIPLIRAAAAQGDADAKVEIFETYRSFTRRNDNPLIAREEAQEAYRSAARLGHPDAMYMLAIYLDRGSFFKRDLDEAIFWAERAVQTPPKGNSLADVQITLGRLLSKSEDREQRVRGLDLLAKSGRADAKSYLADAIRAEGPVRARALYEDALGSYPGNAIPQLSEMLIRGEGGDTDPKRAVKLVNTWTVSDVPAVRAARGRLMMDGKYMEHDPQKGIEFIATAASWSNDVRNEVINLLAEHPSLRLPYSDNLMFDAREAAEVGSRAPSPH
jgi:TPR repeat protein